MGTGAPQEEKIQRLVPTRHHIEVKSYSSRFMRGNVSSNWFTSKEMDATRRIPPGTPDCIWEPMCKASRHMGTFFAEALPSRPRKPEDARSHNLFPIKQLKMPPPHITIFFCVFGTAPASGFALRLLMAPRRGAQSHNRNKGRRQHEGTFVEGHGNMWSGGGSGACGAH